MVIIINNYAILGTLGSGAYPLPALNTLEAIAVDKSKYRAISPCV